MHKNLLGVVLGLAVSLTAASATAAPLITLSSDAPFRNDSWSFGEIFTVGGSNLTVYSLGAYDDEGNGFLTAGGIPVGIFRESDGSLLASTNVVSSDPLSGFYRFADISPLTLLANTAYRVVAVNKDDLYNIAVGTYTFDTAVTYNGYGWCTATTLTRCDNGTGSERVWIANLQFSYASVPEPATLALLGLGLAGIGIAARRRQTH